MANNAQSLTTAGIRRLLEAFDDPGLDAFCLAHFSELYDEFSQGMHKDEKIAQLLDHCDRHEKLDSLWKPVEFRRLLETFDDPGLDAFCLAHFPEVFDKFSRGMRKDEKITLLLDHVRRKLGIKPKSLGDRVPEALEQPPWQGITTVAVVGILACIVTILSIPPITDMLWPATPTPTLTPTSTPTSLLSFKGKVCKIESGWDTTTIFLRKTEFDALGLPIGTKVTMIVLDTGRSVENVTLNLDSELEICSVRLSGSLREDLGVAGDTDIEPPGSRPDRRFSIRLFQP